MTNSHEHGALYLLCTVCSTPWVFTPDDEQLLMTADSILCETCGQRSMIPAELKEYILNG